MRQFCNLCGRKIIEGFCPDPCPGDSRKAYRVMDSEGGEVVCDIVRAKDGTEARAIVRREHLGEVVRGYVVDQITSAA